MHCFVLGFILLVEETRLTWLDSLEILLLCLVILTKVESEKENEVKINKKKKEEDAICP